MEEVRSKSYLRMYENSIKTNSLKDFILITTKNGDEYKNSEVELGDNTINSVIEKHTRDMVKVVFYSRPIGLIDDHEVYGPFMNVGRTIYFGRRMTVAQANLMYHKDLKLPVNQNVIILENGDVISDIEAGAETHYEVYEKLQKIGQFCSKK